MLTIILFANRFVEIMAPVFSREAWRCVWHMIQVLKIFHVFPFIATASPQAPLDPLTQTSK